MGKSTVCRALQLLLTDVKLERAYLERQIRYGSQYAKLSVGDENWSIALAIPAQTQRELKGAAPHVTQYAAGVKSLPRITDKKERAHEFQRYMGSEPTLSDLTHALESEQTANSVWEVIQASSWDDAHKYYEDNGKVLKRTWQSITGQPRWGPEKSGQWVPENFSGTPRASIVKIIEMGKARLENAIARHAVSAHEKAELETRAAGREAAAKAMTEAEQGAAEAQKKIEEESKKLTALAAGNTTVQVTFECYSCNTLNAVKDGKGVKPDEKKPTSKDIKAQMKQIEAQRAVVQQWTAERDRLNQAYGVAAHTLTQAIAAEKALTEGVLAEGDESIEGIRTLLEIAEKELEADELKEKADAAHKAVLENDKIIKTLSPDGLRKQVLVDALKQANDELFEIAQMTSGETWAGWDMPSVRPDLSISFAGGLDYWDLSESEQYRADIIFQVWCARRDLSKLLVIDRADILERVQRNALFTLLRKCGIPSVVAMTCSIRKDGTNEAPDLAAAGLGVTYWIQEHEIKPLDVLVASK